MRTIKEFVASWKDAIKREIDGLDTKPSLTIFQVGDVEASNRYVRNKIKDCHEVGIDVMLSKHDSSITTKELCKIIRSTKTDGIIVQLPLPSHINQKEVTNSIPYFKDVDGFKPGSNFVPCTPGGIIAYLDDIDFKYEGANAVVIGRSKIVGRPMAQQLLDNDCTVTICHSMTKDLKSYLEKADLVICATGKRGIIKSSDAPNAFIVDVGINFNDDGKLCGDVIIEEGDEDRVTPVPGGVGLLTRCMLLENTTLAKISANAKRFKEY